MTEPLPLIRQSERGTFKRCQWRWYQRHVVRIVPKVEKFKEAADFGTIWHQCMERYYLPGTKRGPHPAESWEELAGEVRTTIKSVEQVDDELVKTWEDFYTLGLDLAEAYVERYQGDPHWDILDAERRFTVAIPDVRVPRIESAKGRRAYTPIANLVGTMDLCLRDLNQEHKGRPVVKILDHKTVGRFLSLHYLTLDEQASTYIAVATHALRQQGLIDPDEVVKGMEYNFIRRAKLDDRPRDDKGQARNKAVKADYAYAFEIVKPGDLDAAGIDFMRLDKGKYSLAELESAARILQERNIIGPVYGKVSADQSGESFKRYFVPRTPAERQRQIVRISEEARVMDDVRHGRLPVLKTPTPDCQYCPYFDLCELDESGGDTEYFVSTTMKQDDPYADHREGAANSKKVRNGGADQGSRTI